jgi:hypothetical protein
MGHLGRCKLHRYNTTGGIILNQDYSDNLLKSFIEGLHNGDLDWQHMALCAETDPDAFFPDLGESTKAARQICGDCPVRLRCLEHAITNNEQHGIWGGLAPRERQQIRNKRYGARGIGRPKKENVNAELSS